MHGVLYSLIMKVYVYLHVCCINNWKEITTKLFTALRESGLHDAMTRLRCNLLTTNPEDADWFTAWGDEKLELLGINSCLEHYETPTLCRLHEHAQQEDAYFLYLHTKGVKHRGEFPSITDWVEYLTYFMVYRHETCRAALATYDTVGVNLHRSEHTTHYSGNFWWSKSSYLRTLEPCVYVDYWSPEFWITCKNQGNYLSLWDSHINHYVHRYEPRHYREDAS